MSSINGKQLSILFDVSEIVDGIVSKEGNGVFFASYNILMELLKQSNLKVSLYCSSEKAIALKEAVSKDKNLANVPIINFSDCLKLESTILNFEKLKYKNKQENESKIVRFFIKTTLDLLKLIKKFSLKFNNKKADEFFKDFDIFFSTVGAIPQEIRNVKHIKKFTFIHDVIPLILPEYKKGFKESPFYDLFKTINKSDYYFANSQYTKRDFIKYFPNIDERHITVIPLSTGGNYKEITDVHQIEKVKEKYNIPKNKKYLFSLCTLEPRKNLIFAVKNFIEFIKQNNIDDFVFILGGLQWEGFIEKLSKITNDLGKYKDKIIKIGYVDNEDISALYSGAEMFVYPSIYEGFGMPILEAMKCGCPVICSNVTSMPEVIGDCGLLINPLSDESMIEALKKMYFDEDFKKQCREKGLERAKQFSWEKCAQIIINAMQGASE